MNSEGSSLTSSAELPAVAATRTIRIQSGPMSSGIRMRSPRNSSAEISDSYPAETTCRAIALRRASKTG